MMYDLAALKRYENHINETYSQKLVSWFNQLDLVSQCLIAERWSKGQDHKVDRQNAEGQWT